VSFFAKLKDSTIGFSGYARLVRDPRGGFGFVATLLAVVVAIHGYMTMVEVGRATQQMAQQVESWPEFRIGQGRVEFAGEMPFTETMPDGTRLVIDTTGQTLPENLNVNRGTVLVTSDRFYFMQPGIPAWEMDITTMQGELTKEALRQFLAARPERIISFFYLFVYIVQLAFKALDAALLGLLAQFYANSLRRPIPYEVGYKIGLYAMTLPIIIQWVWKEFTVFSPPGFTIWWTIAGIYAIFGLRAYLANTAPDEPTA